MALIDINLTDQLPDVVAKQKSNNNWLNRNSDKYNQLLAALQGTADIGPLTPTAAQTAPAAPTVAASSSTGALNGAYRYIIVLITGYKNSDLTYNVTGLCPSAEAAPVTITNKQGSLSAIGIGTGAAVIGKAIYRTAAAGAAGTEKYCGIIWDNVTTTYTDNFADASLGTGMPTVSGTAIPAAVPTGNSTGTKISSFSAVGIIGEIKQFGGVVAPYGTLLCNGSAISRTVYANLFAVIGTTWGVGDGSTTFNLPNGKGRTLIGAGLAASGTTYALGATGGEETHQLTSAELPTSMSAGYSGGNGSGSGAIATASVYTSKTLDGYFNLAIGGAGNKHNIMQPYAVINYIIVY